MTRRSEINREAREMIADIAEAKGLSRCELCGGTFGLAPAHKYPRVYYRNEEELADFKEWIVLDQVCHEKMDNRSKTTKEEKDAIFAKLRP